MKTYEEIEKALKENNGILYAKDVERYNINRHTLKELEELGKINRIIHGIYSTPEKYINEFWLMGERYKKGIFSHNTALYFYDLTDRTPLKLDMIFPSNVRINNEYLDTHYIKKDKHLLGVITMEIEKGITIKIYNIERTICDIIRDKNKIDLQIFNNAMKG